MQLSVDQTTITEAQLGFVNAFEGAEDEGEPSSAEPESGITLRLSLRPGAESATVWIQATPRVSELIDQCIANVTSEGRRFRSFEAVTRVSREEAIGGGAVTKFVVDNQPDIYDITYYKVMYTSEMASVQEREPYFSTGSGLAKAPDCLVNSGLFWRTRGSRSSFSFPDVRLEVLANSTSPSVEELNGSGLRNVAEDASNNCLRVSTLWTQGVTPGTAAPRVDVSSEDDFPYHGLTGFNWDNCVDAALDGSYTIRQASTSGDVTDNGYADNLSRSLFFAGVFAGLLGALLIEILNEVFVVVAPMERSESKRISRPRKRRQA